MQWEIYWLVKNYSVLENNSSFISLPYILLNEFVMLLK